MAAADYVEADIATALRSVGVGAGDLVFSHSNVGFFGRLGDAATSAEFYAVFKRAIFSVIGDGGTFVVPTFSYSFCDGKPFDVRTTPGQCGMLSECVRQDADAVRSTDPNFSVAAVGRLAETLCRAVGPHPFGPDSFWDRFLKHDGRFVNFNFDSGTTFMHYVERELQVPYRWDKSFSGQSRVGDAWVEQQAWHYVFDHAMAEHFPDFTKLHAVAEADGVLRTANLGRGQIVSVLAADLDGIIRLDLPRRPDLLIRGAAL